MLLCNERKLLYIQGVTDWVDKPRSFPLNILLSGQFKTYNSYNATHSLHTQSFWRPAAKHKVHIKLWSQTSSSLWVVFSYYVLSVYIYLHALPKMQLNLQKVFVNVGVLC